MFAIFCALGFSLIFFTLNPCRPTLPVPPTRTHSRPRSRPHRLTPHPRDSWLPSPQPVPLTLADPHPSHSHPHAPVSLSHPIHSWLPFSQPAPPPPQPIPLTFANSTPHTPIPTAHAPGLTGSHPILATHAPMTHAPGPHRFRLTPHTPSSPLLSHTSHPILTASVSWLTAHTPSSRLAPSLSQPVPLTLANPHPHAPWSHWPTPHPHDSLPVLTASVLRLMPLVLTDSHLVVVDPLPGPARSVPAD